MAEEKAQSGRSLLLSQPGVLIAADTVVSLDDAVLAKPESAEEAESFLLRLAKRTHEVRSAVCVLASAEAGVVSTIGLAVSLSRVTFGEISRTEAQRYWRSGEPRGKSRRLRYPRHCGGVYPLDRRQLQWGDGIAVIRNRSLAEASRARLPSRIRG